LNTPGHYVSVDDNNLLILIQLQVDEVMYNRHMCHCKLLPLLYTASITHIILTSSYYLWRHAYLCHISDKKQVGETLHISVCNQPPRPTRPFIPAG